LNTGCCLLRLTTADMIKFGEPYVDDSRWQGRQILPPGPTSEDVTLSDEDVRAMVQAVIPPAFQ
jgi:hypothetical protein